MKKTLYILVFVLFGASLQAQTLLDTATNFTVKDPYGNTLHLFDILDQGKIVVIDFFSTTWGTCQAYASDLQAAYEEFGCNDGNVFFLGIDKGNSNEDVIYYDSVYNVHFPGISGQEGGGNEVHLAWEVQATPSLVIIRPDKVIAVKQIFPPNTNNVVDSVLVVGGIQQACLTSIAERETEDFMTVSPNPATNFARINLNLDQEKELQINIINLTGQVVQSFEPQRYPAGKFVLRADLTGQQRGFYFVQAISDNKIIITTKLVLTR